MLTKNMDGEMSLLSIISRLLSNRHFAGRTCQCFDNNFFIGECGKGKLIDKQFLFKILPLCPRNQNQIIQNKFNFGNMK